MASDARARPCYARSRGRQDGKRRPAAAPETRCSARPMRSAIAVRCPAFRPTRRALLRTTGRRQSFSDGRGAKRGHGQLPPGGRHAPAARSRHRAEVDPRLLAALHGADHAARGRRRLSRFLGDARAARRRRRWSARRSPSSSIWRCGRSRAKGLNAKAAVAALLCLPALDPVLGVQLSGSSTSTRRSTPRATMPA